MVMSILHKFLTLKWNISRTIWRIEVGDGSFFCIFHALSCELNFIFDQRFPLNNDNSDNNAVMAMYHGQIMVNVHNWKFCITEIQ